MDTDALHGGWLSEGGKSPCESEEVRVTLRARARASVEGREGERERERYREIQREIQRERDTEIAGMLQPPWPLISARNKLLVPAHSISVIR